MFEEMEALRKNDNWDVVELPSEKKVVECKWVFTSKVDGTIERYKSQVSSKRLYTDLWNRLPRNFLPCCKDKYSPGFVVSCCEFKLALVST